MQDKFKRDINYLRVSITDFCNFRCQYCMPKEGVEKKKREDILSLEEIYHIIHLFVENGVRKVRLTGGEPLLRKNIVALIESIAKLEKIEDLAMTTNAYLLKDMANDLKKAGLKRVNISLDTLDPDKFADITGSDQFNQVWAGIEEALKVGLGVKINTVLMKGVNDDEIEKLASLTLKYPIDVRFIELMPIGQTKEFSQEHFLSCDSVLEKLDLIQLKADDIHSPATLYKLDGALAKVGLIRPMSKHFCQTCNRLRLTADGKIKPCLHSDSTIDLKDSLRRGEDIRPLIDQAIYVKPERHHILEGQTIEESMSRIGG